MPIKTDAYLDYLRKQGYVPELLNTGDISLKVQGETLVVTAAEEDPPYFKLTYYHAWDAKETPKAWEAVNAVNQKIKAIKVCVSADVIYVTAEAILRDANDIEAVFPRYVQLIAAGLQALREALSQVAAQKQS